MLTRQKSILILIPLITTILFVSLSGRPKSFTEAYSWDIRYRLQTQAMLSGNLTISQTPFHMPYDFIWVNNIGLQQNWGLGVPSLRLPFEFIAKKIGFDSFPDQFTFLIYFVLIQIFFLCTVFNFLTHIRSKSKSVITLISCLIVFLNPSFLALFVVDAGIYHEAIAYGYIFAVLCFTAIFKSQFTKIDKMMLPSALLFGLVGFIRPTLLAGGFISMLFLVFQGFKQKKGLLKICTMILIYVSGVSLQLYTNKIRFGSATEFGYQFIHGSFSTGAIYYPNRFQNNFKIVSVFDAAKEMAGTLAFSNYFLEAVGTRFFLNSLPGAASELRFREFTFPTVNFFSLIALILFFLKKGPNENHFWRTKAVFSVYSLVLFLILFGFYMYTPAIASRYIIDFLPIFTFAYMFGAIYLINYSSIKQHNAVLFLTITFVLVFSGRMFISRDALDLQGITDSPAVLAPTSALSNEIKTRINRWQNLKANRIQTLPEEYSCEDKFRLKKQIIMNNLSNWEPESCLVNSMSTFFFNKAQCLNLLLTREPTTSKNEFNDIQIKEGYNSLQLTRITPVKDNLYNLEFCDVNPEKSVSRPIYSYQVGWVKVENFKYLEKPYKLIKISTKK